MGGMNEWQRDIYEGLRRENWSLTGPTRIVKVIPANAKIGTDSRTGNWRNLGYITVGKNLCARTPKQIEADLGLLSGSMDSGAWIYKITQTPAVHQYEYELTAKFPDGLAFNPAHYSPDYPPGAAWVHQWRITDPNFKAFNPIYYALLPAAKLPYAWLLSP
jgi:hypothetical protein